MFIVDEKVIYDKNEHLTIKKNLPFYYEEIENINGKKIGINRLPLIIDSRKEERIEQPLEEEELLSLLRHHHFLNNIKYDKIEEKVEAKIFERNTHIVREEVDSLLYSHVLLFKEMIDTEVGYKLLKGKKKLGLYGYKYYLYYINTIPVIVKKRKSKEDYNVFGIPIQQEKINKLDLKKLY